MNQGTQFRTMRRFTWACTAGRLVKARSNKRDGLDHLRGRIGSQELGSSKGPFGARYFRGTSRILGTSYFPVQK
jgi:hypothetical protein